MGQEFAFVFDIIIIAAAIGFTFAGIKKGFAKVILEALSVIIAFWLAFLISEPVSQGIYGSFIEKPLEKAISEAVGETEEPINENPFGDAELDFDKITISGVPASEVEPNYEGTSSAVMDLSDVDFSGSGIENLDLSLFGVPEDTDFSSVNAKTANFSGADIEKYGLGKLTAAQYLASCAVKSDMSEALDGVINAVRDFLPMMFTDANSDSVNVSSVRTIVLAMFDTKSSVKTALMDGMISPPCITFIRTLTAIVLFALFAAILSIVCRVSGLMNKVPVLGKINALLGGIAGFCEAAVTAVLICFVTGMIVSLFGGSVILFNETAINSTLVFKHIYYLDLIGY